MNRFASLISGLLAFQSLAAPQTLQDALRSSFRPADHSALHTEFLSVSPPLAIDPQLSSPDLNTALASALVLADTVPLPTSTYQSSGRTTYGVYEVVLNNKQIVSSPLSKSDKHQLNAAERILIKHRCWLAFWLWGTPFVREPSKGLLKYRRYEATVAELQTQIQRTQDPKEREALQRQLSLELSEWEACGKKARIDKALRDFQTITERQPQAFWIAASDIYSMNTRILNGARVPLTGFSPPPASWANESNWSLWTNSGYSAQVKTIDIVRPWMNVSVLTTEKWSWADGTYKREGTIISDGLGVNPLQPGNELMPLLPTSILIARAIRFQGQNISGAQPVIVGIFCEVLPPQPPQ